MKAKSMTAQRRGLCVFAGMAIGFRIFFAVMVDGERMLNSGWISILLGALLAAPVALILMLLRRQHGAKPAGEVLSCTLGRRGARLYGAVLFVLMTYETAASVRLLCDTARHVALSALNPTPIILVTMVAAMIAAVNGAEALAGAAVLWNRLCAILLVFLMLLQLNYYRPAFITPLLGPGVEEIVQGAWPVGGMCSFIAIGWLMLEPDEDGGGWAFLHTLIIAALTAAATAVACAMLVPTVIGEPFSRTYHLEHLLVNDRAGLSLELPYVVLIYSGMLTMIFFELAAAARALMLALPQATARTGAIFAGSLACVLAVGGLANHEELMLFTPWYYPLVALPMLAAAGSSLLSARCERRRPVR